MNLAPRKHSMAEALPTLAEVRSTSSTTVAQVESDHRIQALETQGTFGPNAIKMDSAHSKSNPSLGGRSHQSLSAPASASSNVPISSPAKSTAASLSAVNELSPELAAARAAAAASAALQQPFTLSASELAAAFTCLSTDGQRVTRTDIRDFLAFYFPDMPEKLERTLLGGNNKEDREIGLATLLKVMSKKKDMAVCTYQDLSKVVTSGLRLPYTDGVVMSQPAVKVCIETMSKRAAIKAPSDLNAMMARLDKDKDGAIGLEDWKAIRTLCDEHPKLIRLLDTL